MKILLVTGGISSERKISFLSARQVKIGLEEESYKVKLFDLKKGYSELKKVAKEVDVIFPVIHGEEGEGGNLHKFLSTLHIPFVGGDWAGYKKGWYKIPFKKFCNQHKILTANWKKVENIDDILKFGFPAVLKSSSGGSSKEVVILKSGEDLKNPLVKKLLQSQDQLLIEKYLSGTEITIAILGSKALPAIEIIPPSGGWFDYKNKYSGQTQEIPFAPSVAKKIQIETQKIASKIHQMLNLGQFSRIDFIIFGGKPYVLEVNTIPGLTSASLFPKAALASGISFPKLLSRIVKMAIKRV